MFRVESIGQECSNKIFEWKIKNGEPSSTRWLYWSRIKDISFCFEKNLPIKSKNSLAFHLGPVQPPSGEGSPLVPMGHQMFTVQIRLSVLKKVQILSLLRFVLRKFDH